MSDWRRWLVTAAVVGMPGCDSCVARGARVRTREGERPIEDLRIGDEVLSFDPGSGEPVPGAILAVRSVKRETVLLRAAGRDLIATSDHPVYCPDEGVYAPAGDWALRHRTRLWQAGADGPRAVPIELVSTAAGVREVFDLSVDTPHHNFLASGFLVHNKRPLPPSCDYGGRQVYQGTECDCGGGPFGRVVCDGADGRCDCPVHDGGDVDGG